MGKHVRKRMEKKEKEEKRIQKLIYSKFDLMTKLRSFSFILPFELVRTRRIETYMETCVYFFLINLKESFIQNKLKKIFIKNSVSMPT